MKNIGIFYNPFNYKDGDYLNEKISALRKRSLKVFLLAKQHRTELDSVEYIDTFSKDIIDLLVVFGGDGTMLMAAKLVIEENVPIIGFNLGKLGFLSECEKDEFNSDLTDIINNNYYIEERLVLSCYLKKNNNYKHYAINDCVIYKGEYPKLINIEVNKDNKFVYVIRADGVIISTPNGSTAYSLSAGGPIIYPESDVIVLTPINPHNLFLRPIIFPASSKLNIILKDNVDGVHLNIDGEDIGNINANDNIYVEKSKFYSKFIKLSDKNFCKILREKFNIKNKF
ncbi:MAG: NAD(+)/NADH kinase [Candidatus Cloacimonetes bacterium]|nr:NAD(+)/NADH kinase [Candidatus Cloacimonadota bacterium]